MSIQEYKYTHNGQVNDTVVDVLNKVSKCGKLPDAKTEKQCIDMMHEKIGEFYTTSVEAECKEKMEEVKLLTSMGLDPVNYHQALFGKERHVNIFEHRWVLKFKAVVEGRDIVVSTSDLSGGQSVFVARDFFYETAFSVIEKDRQLLFAISYLRTLLQDVCFKSFDNVEYEKTVVFQNCGVDLMVPWRGINIHVWYAFKPVYTVVPLPKITISVLDSVLSRCVDIIAEYVVIRQLMETKSEQFSVAAYAGNSKIALVHTVKLSRRFSYDKYYIREPYEHVLIIDLECPFLGLVNYECIVKVLERVKTLLKKKGLKIKMSSIKPFYSYDKDRFTPKKTLRRDESFIYYTKNLDLSHYEFVVSI